MRGTRVKNLRKEVYQEHNWRDRKYKINSVTDTITCDKFRQAYQRVKHDWSRNCLIKAD